MKRVLFTLLACVVFIGFIPINVDAATNTENWTLKDYKDAYQKYKDEYDKNQANLNKTQAEIEKANKDIENTKKEIISLAAEIGLLREDVTLYKEEITQKELQTKKLIEYKQLSSGNNLFLEYAFEAEDVTDLLYRMDLVEQLTTYNNDMINELNGMIEANKEREKEINEKEKELTNKELELGEKVEALGEEKSSLSTGAISISDTMKAYQKQIQTYKNGGCKDDDVVGVDCMQPGSLGTWRRPTSSGYITSSYGMRSGSFHRGIDIGNARNGQDPYKTKIYSVADGEVGYVGHDKYKANVVVVWHYDPKTKTYYSSNYCHMSTVNVKVHQKVTSNTVIGYMGSTGYTKGPHLHLEIFPCRQYEESDRNCSNWTRYVNYATKMLNNGYKGPTSVINFPKSGVRWTDRDTKYK